MKLTRVKHLQQLASSMHPHEQESLGKVLENFIPARKGTLPVAFDFWEVLQTHSDPNELRTELHDQFGENKANRISRQWQRAFAQNLLLGHNLDSEGAYSETARQRMRIEQQMLFAYALIERDLTEEALDHLNEIEEEARKYDLYESLVKILYAKADLLEIAGEFDKIEQCFDDAMFFEECLAAATRAKKAYYKAIQNYGFKAHSHSATDVKRLEMLAADIAVLASDFEATQSAMVNYYYHLLKVEYLQLQQQFSEATKYCLDLLDVIRNNPSVYHSRRLGIAYLNLSQNELFNHFFDYALGFAQQAPDYFEPGSRNQEICLELEFYALFYAGKTRSSGEVLNQLLSLQSGSASGDDPDFRTSWRFFLRACVHFVMGDFREVHRTLHEATQINRDKEGWNLGMRILTVMNMLELNLKDHADAEIENLRNFARRSLAGAPIRQRDRVIVELFTALKRHNYDYYAVASHESALLERLASMQNALAWKVQTPEMIPVHKWFEAKVLKRPYRPDYSQEALFVWRELKR